MAATISDSVGSKGAPYFKKVADSRYKVSPTPPWNPRLILSANKEVEVGLLQAAGCQLDPVPATGVIEVQDSDASKGERRFTVRGVAKGMATVYLKDGHGRRVKDQGAELFLKITVLEPRTVNLAFFPLQDSGGHTSTKQNASRLAQAVKQANDILQQADVAVENILGGLRPLEKIPKDMGSPITTAAVFRDNAWAGDLLAVKARNPGAHLYVFFIWGLTDANGQAEEGQTWVPDAKDAAVLLQDSVAGGQDGIALAHEVGHFLLMRFMMRLAEDFGYAEMTDKKYRPYLGLPDGLHSDDASQLMYADLQGGTAIPPSQALAMNAACGKL